MRRNGHISRKRQRGFSIIELLIALIIIGILAAILIPLIANRTEKARIAAAESDLERMALGMDSIAIDVGYYPRLFLLNDSSGADRDGMLQTTGAGGGDDTVRQYVNAGASPVTQNLDQLFMYVAYPRVGSLVDAGIGSDLRQRMATNETDFNWNGSYVNWRLDSNLAGDLPDGIPDDPWGNNYLLFVGPGVDASGTSRQGGVLLEPDGIIESSSYLNSPTQVFDRPTLLSMGPDGVPGSGVGGQFGQGDDIVRQFGP